MDATTRALYWKYEKRHRYIDYASWGLKFLSMALGLMWITGAATLLNDEQTPLVIQWLVVMQGLIALLPFLVSVVVDLVLAFSWVELRCAGCMHRLARHESSNGEKHVCKERHGLFLTKRCLCPEFTAAETL